MTHRAKSTPAGSLHAPRLPAQADTASLRQSSSPPRPPSLIPSSHDLSPTPHPHQFPFHTSVSHDQPQAYNPHTWRNPRFSPTSCSRRRTSLSRTTHPLSCAYGNNPKCCTDNQSPGAERQATGMTATMTPPRASQPRTTGDTDLSRDTGSKGLGCGSLTHPTDPRMPRRARFEGIACDH